MLEKPEDILRKFKKAVTDSDACVRYDPAAKPGVSNLMQIYAVATGSSFEQIEKEFDGRGYGDFKKAVGESVVELLRPSGGDGAPAGRQGVSGERVPRRCGEGLRCGGPDHQ